MEKLYVELIMCIIIVFLSRLIIRVYFLLGHRVFRCTTLNLVNSKIVDFQHQTRQFTFSFNTGIYQMKVEENWVISFHKPTFNKPLRPGTWKVKIVYNENTVLGEVSFLVVPLAYHKGKPVTLENVVNSNNGPSAGLYSSDFIIEFDREANDTSKRVKEFTENSYHTGSRLENWIDKLVSDYWIIKDSCVVGNSLSGCGNLESCHRTSWSSRSPDLKSEIGKINKEGRIR